MPAPRPTAASTAVPAGATLRLGTRGSALALTQSGLVAEALRAAGQDVELVVVRTDGDRLPGSLSRIGGTGVFVTALRDALLQGRCDLAVHSLKDLPTAPAEGVALVAVPPREDPRDVLCARGGATLASLPDGARVGTGSPRRAAQLHLVRPDLEVVDIRGNVDTRLGRLDLPAADPRALEAVVLARAGLARLGRLDAVTQVIPADVVMPAPGQGALAVECRASDLDALGPVLGTLDHPPTRAAVTAERALLAALQAGCTAPVGALARLDAGPAGTGLHLDAVLVDGAAVRASGSVPAADVDDATARRLGRDVAARLLARPAAASPRTPDPHEAP